MIRVGMILGAVLLISVAGANLTWPIGGGVFEFSSGK